MKIIVLGGAGFIGSHVADELFANGHDVKIFDKTLSHHLGDGQDMIVGDVADEKAINEAVQGCDIVYNFAAIADLDECQKHPIDVVKANIIGNITVLEACRKAGVKRYVFASTVYVYGDWGGFYRSSKQSCESFIEEYNKIYGLPYTVLRYGSLYGDRADDKNYIYRLIKEGLTDGTLTHNGSGDEMREWVHVQDAAHMSAKILDDVYKNESVIITGQRNMKYRELLEMIKEVLKGDVQIKFEPEMRKVHYNITPCTFSPKFAKKMIPGECIDIGQGLLQCVSSVFDEINQQEAVK